MEYTTLATETAEELQEQARAMEREAAAGMPDAPDPLTERCNPIRVRDFLIELSEQTGNEGIVNEWLDQLGLAPYRRSYDAAVSIRVRVDATTPAEAMEILRGAQWSNSETIDIDDVAPRLI